MLAVLRKGFYIKTQLVLLRNIWLFVFWEKPFKAECKLKSWGTNLFTLVLLYETEATLVKNRNVSYMVISLREHIKHCLYKSL